MKILRWVLSVIIILILCSMFLLFTQLGLKTTVFIAKKMIPGELKIKRIQGTLTSRIALEEITYHNQNISATCQSVQIDWSLFAFFRHGKIDFYHVDLNNFIIALSNTEQSSHSTFSLRNTLQKLSYFNFYQLNFNSINLQYAQHVLFFNALQIKQNASNYNIELQPSHGKLISSLNFEINPALTWQVQLNGQQLDPHDFISSETGLINFTANTQGKWRDGLFENSHFVLNDLNGKLNNQPLQGKFELVLDHHAIYFNQGNINLANALATIQGFIKPNETNVSWYLAIPKLSDFYPRFTGELLFKGQLLQKNGYYLISDLLAKNIKMADVRIKQMEGHATTEFSTELLKINLNIKQLDIAHYTIPMSSLTIDAKLTYPELATHGVLNLNPHNQLLANLIFKINEKLTEIPMSGNIKLNLNTLSALIKTKAIKKLAGNITGLLNISGTLTSPHVEGDINLLNGQVTLPKLGITPRFINIKSHINQYQPVNFSGSFLAGKGHAQIKGHVDFYHPYQPFAFQFVGNNLQILNLPEYQLNLSPDIHVTHDASYQNMNVTGTVNVPYLKIKTNSVAQAVTLPPEVTVVGINNKTFFTPSNMKMRLHVTLGEQIHVAYQHLLATLSGDLFINQLPGGFPTATGTLYVNEGSYFLYNQYLTIQNGRLIYLGNEIRNPMLDLSAIKKINQSSIKLLTAHEEKTTQTNEEDNYVGALVQGTLLNPNITLISNPTMSQNDILSYILFGRPLNQTSGNPFAIVGTASSALNLMSPNASDGTTPASPLTTGIMKLGAFNPVQAFSFSYPWSNHFSFKTESSIEEVGADLVYNYDQD